MRTNLYFQWKNNLAFIDSNKASFPHEMKVISEYKTTKKTNLRFLWNPDISIYIDGSIYYTTTTILLSSYLLPFYYSSPKSSTGNEGSLFFHFTDDKTYVSYGKPTSNGGNF